MHQPATVVVVPPHVAHVPAHSQGGCSCSVPANVSQHVKAARGATIAIIVIHAVALLAAGWWMWNLWMASLIAFIMGGIQLCMFTKCTYMVAGSLYIVGCIFDLTAMAWWIAAAQYVADANNDDQYDDWGDHLGWFALPAAFGALAFLIGAVYTWLAVCNWDVSGAPDAMGVGVPAGGAQVMQPNHNVQTTQGKAQPPPYANV